MHLLKNKSKNVLRLGDTQGSKSLNDGNKKSTSQEIGSSSTVITACPDSTSPVESVGSLQTSTTASNSNSSLKSSQEVSSNEASSNFQNLSKKDVPESLKCTPQPITKAETSSVANGGSKSTSKRKLFSSPGLYVDDEDKKNVTPKRKKFNDGSGSSGGLNVTPKSTGNQISSTNTTPKSCGVSGRLSVPLSERQQMALLLQMTAESSDPPRSPISSLKSPKESILSKRLNKRNEKGETPLHSATIKGDVKLVKKLIRQGADINIPDFAGWTPLHEASNHGWYEISKCLLKAGATVNVRGLDDDTPLHDASINGHKKLVELLVKCGANPLQANKRGKSPIDVATTDEVKQILKRETISYSSDDSGTEDPRSPTSPESDVTDTTHDDDVHSTSLDNDADNIAVTKSIVTYVHSEDISQEAKGIGESLEIDVVEGSSSNSRSVASSTAVNLPTQQALRQSAVPNIMKRNSPPQSSNNKCRPDKPSSPRLTLRFQSIRAKDNKVNNANSSSSSSATAVQSSSSSSSSSTSKCVTGEVSSSEAKYQSYFVTMESKEDVYEFKQDTPPPLSLSASRTVLAATSSATVSSNVTEAACDSQSGPAKEDNEVLATKGCDSSTQENPSIGNNSESADANRGVHSKSGDDNENVEDMVQPNVSRSSGRPESAVSTDKHVVDQNSDVVSSNDEHEVRKKRRKDDSMDSSPNSVVRGHVSSTSKASASSVSTEYDSGRQAVANAEVLSSTVDVDHKNKTLGDNASELVDAQSAADSKVSSDPNASELQSVSSSLSPQSNVANASLVTGYCSSESSGSSSPKVPPLKIVIPQSSEQDSKDRNKSNNQRQALPYVVNSSENSETTTCTTYSTAINCQSSDAVRLICNKSADIQVGAGNSAESLIPERTSQRVTRSSQRIQAAMAGVSGQSNDNLSNVDSSGNMLSTSNVGRTGTDSGDDMQQVATGNIDVQLRKRKLRSRDSVVAPAAMTGNAESNQSSPASSTSSHEDQPIMNCYHMYLAIRKQVDKRRKGMFVVQPKPPQGYKDYLLNRCTYVLHGNASSRLSVPMIPAPQSLSGPLKDLFVEQEKERYKLRLQHLIEKEKLVLSVEQEILRVHARAARALANQTVPLSVCTILRDEEIYNTIEPEQEEKDKHVRSRYNGRLFLSWLQDVDDKWEKIKGAMLLRHHNEAESLHAVQKITWEWKMKEVGACDSRTTPIIDDLHVPMVHVSDDFDLLPA